jgi:hypothetical protein
MKKLMLVSALGAMAAVAGEATKSLSERVAGSFGLSHSETLRVSVINNEMDTARFAVRFYDEDGKPLKAVSIQALGGGLRVRSTDLTGSETASVTAGVRPQIQVTIEPLGSWDGSLMPGEGEYNVCAEVFETATGRGAIRSCKTSSEISPKTAMTK